MLQDIKKRSKLLLYSIRYYKLEITEGSTSHARPYSNITGSINQQAFRTKEKIILLQFITFIKRNYVLVRS